MGFNFSDYNEETFPHNGQHEAGPAGAPKYGFTTEQLVSIVLNDLRPFLTYSDDIRPVEAIFQDVRLWLEANYAGEDLAERIAQLTVGFLGVPVVGLEAWQITVPPLEDEPVYTPPTMGVPSGETREREEDDSTASTPVPVVPPLPSPAFVERVFREIEGIGGGLEAIVEGAVETVEHIVTTVDNALEGTVDGLTEAVGNIANGLGESIEIAIDGIGTEIEGAYNLINDTIDDIGDEVETVVKGVTNAVEDVIEGLTDMLDNLLNPLEGIVLAINQAIRELIDFLKWLWEEFKLFWIGLLEQFIAFLRELTSFDTEQFTEFLCAGFGGMSPLAGFSFDKCSEEKTGTGTAS